MTAQDEHTEKGSPVTGTAPGPSARAASYNDPRRGNDPKFGAHHSSLADQGGHLKRLRRIEGQVRGLQRMIDDGQYCIDILTQISATTRALQSVALTLLDEHLSTCVVRAARAGGDEAETRLAEASDAIARLVRS